MNANDREWEEGKNERNRGTTFLEKGLPPDPLPKNVRVRFARSLEARSMAEGSLRDTKDVEMRSAGVLACNRGENGDEDRNAGEDACATKNL